MTTPHDTALLLTVKEAAHQLRVGRSTAYKLIAKGEIETVLVGTSRRVVPESLRDYVGRLRTTVD